MSVDNFSPSQPSDPPSPRDEEEIPRLTRDQTLQWQQNLSSFSLVCDSFTGFYRLELYKNVHISTASGLGFFLDDIRFQPDIAKLVKRLFLDIELCGKNVSGSENNIFCLNIYRVLDKTSKLEFLSLDLKECSCCFRISGVEDMATDEANTGHDTFYAAVANRTGNESTFSAKYRRFLPLIRRFRFTSTQMPYKHCAFFALQSLVHVESVRNTGSWSTILEPSFGIGIFNPHVKTLMLESSSLIPSEASIVADAFPNSEVLTTGDNPY